MEWTWVVTTTLPVLTWIGGQWWTRADGDRRENRAFFRNTILELQDTLEALWATATGGARNEYRAAYLRTLTLMSRITNFRAKELTDLAVDATDAILEAAEARDADARKKAVTAAAQAIVNANAHLSALLRDLPWRYVARAEPASWRAGREKGKESDLDEA